MKNAIDDQRDFSLIRFASHAVAEFRNLPYLVVVPGIDAMAYRS